MRPKSLPTLPHVGERFLCSSKDGKPNGVTVVEWVTTYITPEGRYLAARSDDGFHTFMFGMGNVQWFERIGRTRVQTFFTQRRITF